MNKYFEINHLKSGLRTGKLIVGEQELVTPLLVHPESILHYLKPEQVRATQTKAIYCDPIVIAEKLKKKDLTNLPNLRRVLGWSGAILTTSGATEIAKLAKPRGYKKTGINFRLPNEGQLISLSPSTAISLQEQLGASITEQLYRDVDYYAPVDDLAAAVELTGRWYSKDQDSLFPVTGGGLKKLHRQSIGSVTGRPPFGYLITQTEHVDSPGEVQRNLSAITEMLPVESLRVTKTGVSFQRLLAAIASGIDVVYSDVAIHEALMGNALVADGKRLNLTHASFENDWTVLDPACQCPVCIGHYSRAALHYLAKTNSPQYVNLILEHNLFWLNQFVVKYLSR